MDNDRVEEYGGFSLAKIMLSDVLPASLYYPGEEGIPKGKDKPPALRMLRRETDEDA